jgi:bacillolysin
MNRPKAFVLLGAVLAVLLLSLDTGRAQRASPGAATSRTAVPRVTPRDRGPSTQAPRAAAQGTPVSRTALVRVSATTSGDLLAWDAYVTDRLRTGGLRARRIDRDPALPTRTVERLQQFHQGVPVFGAELVRDSQDGVPVAIFGEMSPDFSLETMPQMTEGAAERRMAILAGADATVLRSVELTILRRDTGEPRLAYMATMAAGGDVFRLFVDATTGAELMRYSEIHTQAAVGTGRGVLGDTKKLSVLRQGSLFLADDQHRPPVLTTFDMQQNLPRADAVVFAGGPLSPADVASDADNNWTDPAAVDAHVHVGWTYDYFFKRFGRRGLDDADRPVVVVTNAVSQQGALSLSSTLALRWAVNAFWCGACGPAGLGVIFFGNGIPPGVFLIATGRNYTYFAGALDIAAHELAHGVTDSSSRLIYQNESGALNEAFSDIIGTSVEFFFHRPGTGLRTPDYLLGEDIARAAVSGARDGDRSMADPGAYGHPDHYSRRFLGFEDNGGVHINSGIANHAFYLAIEGGTNRTSGLSVQGVGAANRLQIERVFYRAFVFLMPASSTFSTARAATIQAARDLYGVGSAPEQAVTQAWTAVGVE